MRKPSCNSDNNEPVKNPWLKTVCALIQDSHLWQERFII